MKFVDEYRRPEHCQRLLSEIRQTATRPWTLMEVCGGQTHGLLRYGIDTALEGVVRLIHGPGCPVCVTPLEAIDSAIDLSRRPNVTVTSFGDMLRVPGQPRKSAAGTSRRRQCSYCLFAARCRAICRAASGSRGCLFRRRLRNDGAGDGAGRSSGRRARSDELLAHRVARASSTGDGNAGRQQRQLGPRISWPPDTFARWPASTATRISSRSIGCRSWLLALNRSIC